MQAPSTKAIVPIIYKDKTIKTRSWKKAKDVTAEVVPDKPKGDPLARARRKFKKASLKQLVKWGRRLLKTLHRYEAGAKAWMADIPEDSPLQLKDYPLVHQMLATRATLEAIGGELATRTHDEQASQVMEVAKNTVAAVTGEK